MGQVKWVKAVPGTQPYGVAVPALGTCVGTGHGSQGCLVLG